MEQVVNVLQVAGVVVAGLVVYTLVALVVLAWLGHRYHQFTQRAGVALPPQTRPVAPAAA